MELQAGYFIDALIIAGAFLLRLVVFHLCVRLMSRSASHVTVLKSVLVNVLIALVMSEGVPRLIGVMPPHLLDYQLHITGALLLFLAVVLTRMVVDVNWLISLSAGLILGGLSLASDHCVPLISKRFVPEGSSFAEFRNRTQTAMEAARAAAEREKGPEFKRAGAMRRGLDALATLTSQSERDSMREDFQRGMEMYAERKRLMEEMTPQEREEYRQAMAEFMKEMQMDPAQYSVDRIGKISTNDISKITAALVDLQRLQESGGTETAVVDETAGMRSISESLLAITTNLTSVSATARDRETLNRFATLFGSNELDQAVATVRQEFVSSGGSNAVCFALMAAVSQMKNSPGKRALSGRAEALAKLKAPVEGGANGTSVSNRVAVKPRKVIDPRFDLVSVPTMIGEVRIPRSIQEPALWAAAADQMQIKGYMSWGDETAILLRTGGMLERGNEWRCVSKGMKYVFKVDAVKKGHVTLRVPPDSVPIPVSAPVPASNAVSAAKAPASR